MGSEMCIRDSPKQHDNLDALKVWKPLLGDEKAQRPYNIQIATALKALADNNICLVEYGAQVQFRCGYEEVPVVSELNPSTMMKGRLY